jgi:hypothetical protein
MCFRAPPSTLHTVVRDVQARSESLLDILWEKEVFFLLSQLHLKPFTGSARANLEVLELRKAKRRSCHGVAQLGKPRWPSTTMLAFNDNTERK